MNPSATNPIIDTVKALRVRADALLNDVKEVIVGGALPQELVPAGDTPELLALRLKAHDAVVTKLIEAKMWLGKILEGMGNPFPANLADKAPAPSNTVAADNTAAPSAPDMGTATPPQTA